MKNANCLKVVCCCIIIQVIEDIKDEIEKSMQKFNSKKYSYYLVNFHDIAIRAFLKKIGTTMITTNFK